MWRRAVCSLSPDCTCIFCCSGSGAAAPAAPERRRHRCQRLALGKTRGISAWFLTPVEGPTALHTGTTASKVRTRHRAPSAMHLKSWVLPPTPGLQLQAYAVHVAGMPQYAGMWLALAEFADLSWTSLPGRRGLPASAAAPVLRRSAAENTCVI
jgi:hypothetical protein